VTQATVNFTITQETKKMATTAQIKSINALYVGYFNRAADPVGLQFWINAVDGGATINTIANAFAADSEAAALYPFLTTPGVTTPASFVGSIYLNLFNRTADAEGLKFWTDALAAKQVTAGDMIETITNAALTTDKDILDNKIVAAQYYTENAASTPGYTFSNADAKASLNGVTEDVTTIVTSKAATDGTVATGATAGESFALTTSVTAGSTDNIIGDASDNIIDGSIINSLQNADVIDGKGGNDTLNASVSGAAANAPVITNVENINLTVIGSAGGLASQNWGTAKIGVTGTASGTTTIATMADGQSVTMNSLNHSLVIDSLTATNTNAITVTLAAGGDVGNLDVDGAGANDFDALTLVSAGAADSANTVTLTTLMNDGAGTTANPTETIVIEGTNSLTLDGTAVNLSGASVTATALADGKTATLDITGATTAFNAANLTDVDVLSFTAATGVTTIALANLTGLKTGQVVQLNNNVSSALSLQSVSGLSATNAVTLNLNDADLQSTLGTGNAFTSVEAITVNSGGAANTITGAITLAASSGSSLTITGDQNLSTTAAIGNTSTQGVIDASALTGRLIMATSSDLTIETVTGGTGNDTLIAVSNVATAGSRSLAVDGGAGNDIITTTAGGATDLTTIAGGAGNDIITSGAGIDTIDGGAGNDTIVSNGAADVISGGEGTDTITGGAGADAIDLTETTAAVDTLIRNGDGTTDGSDRVTGFSVTNDIIDLTTSSAAQYANLTSLATVASASTLDNGLTIYSGNDAATLSTANVAVALAASTVVDANTGGDLGYLAVSDGADTGIYLFTDGAGTTAITAGELTLMVTLVGVADATTLTAANFADFT
jgi:hypothetical protein